MNDFTYIEFALVGIIILIQVIQAIKTFKKINLLKSIIPKKEYFRISSFNIPMEDLQSFEPREILTNLSNYQIKVEKDFSSFKYTYDILESLSIEDIKSKVLTDFSEDVKGTQKSEIINEAIAIQKFYSEHDKSDVRNSFENKISLINPNDKSNLVFEGLLNSVNVYLLRNKGATTDFNLIKDITERNVDTEDEDISQRITTPLYLGLMGTMLGIIFGLINLFFVSGDGDKFEIQGFLIGVSIAMSASLVGLLFTVINSTYYKDARKSVEKAKNDFYTFIQTELLPILNQSVSSSIYMLHTNLVKFNDDFTININRLSGLLNKNYDAVIAQDSILQSLEKIDITEFAKANVKVLRELKAGTKDLQNFNQYLGALDSTVTSTTSLSNSLQTLLNKVDNFAGLAERLDSRVEESNKLVQFLNDHFQVLDERSLLINDSVKKVDDVLNKSLVELRDHTSEKINAIRELTIKDEDLITKATTKKIQSIEETSSLEKDLMSKAFEEKMDSIKELTKKEKELLSAAFSENKNNLAKLSLLENLNETINEIKKNGVENSNLIKLEIKFLKSSIEDINNTLNKFRGLAKNENPQSFLDSIKNLFSSIKNNE